MRLVDRIWNGNENISRIGRVMLSPFEALYRGVVSIRGDMYDKSLIESVGSAIPVVSVGNLTVGGTGKTPVASWIATRLADMGMTPAIIMRGYGGDEILVHRYLTPNVAVVAHADRAAGIARAAADGATVAVLDDAFQHRRAKRDVDIVLFGADNWTGRARLLPAGPWREPMSAAGRASIAVVTRKAASDKTVAEMIAAIESEAPALPHAVVAFGMDSLVNSHDKTITRSVGALSGRKVLAVSAIGNPHAFVEQLRQRGAIVTATTYPDHYAFTGGDVMQIVAASNGHEMIVCTLKDVVKLESKWPADAPPLWYVSQSVTVQSGAAEIDRLLARIQSHTPTQPA